MGFELKTLHGNNLVLPVLLVGNLAYPLVVICKVTSVTMKGFSFYHSGSLVETPAHFEKAISMTYIFNKSLDFLWSEFLVFGVTMVFLYKFLINTLLDFITRHYKFQYFVFVQIMIVFKWSIKFVATLRMHVTVYFSYVWNFG